MTDITALAPETGLIPPVLLVLALALDWILGDMQLLFRFVPHPVVLMGRLIGILDKKLNRPSRSERARIVRGLLVTLFVVGLSAAAGWGIENLTGRIPYGWLVDVFLVSVLLAGRSLFAYVGRVAGALKKDGLAGGRKAVAHIVGRDPSALDQHGVARAAVESLSENFSDGVVAPAFWYALLGLPGIFAYKAINTLDSMIGYRTEKHAAFGMVAAKLDDAVNWIPARLSGLAIMLAACVIPRAHPVAAFRAMAAFAGRHASPNAGWPEGAMAGALNLALGGPRRYPGGVSEAAWIGDGRARLTPADIRAAQSLYVVANILIAIAALAGVVLADGLPMSLV